MKFKPSFTSELPTTPSINKLIPEPFMRYNNPYDKAIRQLEIPAASRFRHVYVAGASQYGKSTLLEHMISQDMNNNEGLTLLDPKGDLAEAVLNRVPPHRTDDCIYIDIKNPIPIDFMGWETEDERQTLLADVNQTFMRFSAMAAGDQWGPILRWTISTLLAAKEVSFLDIYYFFTHEDRHDTILELVERNNNQGQYDEILHYWAREFPKVSKPKEGPILTRMGTFITTPPLKRMLGRSERPLKIFDCMESRKILIVNLMGVGRVNGNLVGALLTSKIQQAAFRRQGQSKSDRVPHFFYADEFQNFQTSDFETMFSEAGGFKLSLTLANQGLYQLESQIKQSVFTNVNAARIAFHLNHDDVSNWRHLLPSNPEQLPDGVTIEPDRLANLPPYNAFFKIGNEEGLIAPTPPPLPPPTKEQTANAEIIRRKTLDNYPSSKASSAQSSTIRTGDNSSSNSPPVRHDEVNGNSTPQDQPSGGPPPSVPPHEGKKGNPRNTG
jgi:hypothetical protein